MRNYLDDFRVEAFVIWRWLLPIARFVASLLVLLSLIFAVAGCTIQLSPAYDEATYTSLVELNVKTETLFASLSGGGTAADFPAYKPTYDQLIGGFSAARMATATREVPAAGLRLAGAGSNAVCADNPADCVKPTPHHLDKIIVLLIAMRDAHQHGKLIRGLDVGGFKNQYEIEMSRVLLFEAALKR
jgi:hypothetical protein